MNEEEEIPESGNLNLSTLVDVPEIGVIIDDVWYPYAPHWRWSLIERARFGSLYSDMLDIERLTSPNIKDQARFTELQSQLCAVVCPSLPMEKIKALPSDGQRGAMIVDFLTRSGGQAEVLVPTELQKMMAIMRQSPGAKPSRASRRATARKTG